MAKTSWDELLRDRHDEQQRGHLVVACVEQPDVAAGETRSLRGPSNLLLKLIRRLGPQSDYAMIIARDSGAPEIRFAFARPADAERFAAAVGARPISRYPGWDSQRGFRLDEAAGHSIAAALGSDGQLDERRAQSTAERTDSRSGRSRDRS